MRLMDFDFNKLGQVIINGRCPPYRDRGVYGFWADNYYFEISLERGILEVWSDSAMYSYPIEDVSSYMNEKHIELLFQTLDAALGCVETKGPYYVGRWHFTTDDGVHVQYRSIRDLNYISDMGYTIVATIYSKVLS